MISYDIITILLLYNYYIIINNINVLVFLILIQFGLLKISNYAKLRAMPRRWNCNSNSDFII